MQGKKTSYMGMTGTQVAILAGLSLVAVLAICAAAWVILSIRSMGSTPTVLQATSPAPISPPVSAATQAPQETATEPASVATLTATVMPAEQAMATSAPGDGWKQFQTTGATLWLPANFVGGDVLNHKEQVILNVARLGSSYSNVANGIRKSPAGTVLWMIDKNGSKSMLITTVKAVHQTLSADTTLQKYIDDYLAAKSGIPTINGSKKMVLVGRETRRLTYQELVGTLEYTRVDYFIKDDADFWVVSYFMDANLYFDTLPIIEQSMHTFYLSK